MSPGDFPSFPAELASGPEAALHRRLNRFLLLACASTKAERFAAAAQMRQALHDAVQPRPKRRRSRPTARPQEDQEAEEGKGSLTTVQLRQT
jgi:hypothetical protein